MAATDIEPSPEIARMPMTDARATPPAGEDYEQLPYASMPYAFSQPARLAAVAALHGLAAPAPERARVLELGCASGGNLIPLAARFPDARFLGIDLARRHVEEARERIDALGLSNIEARQADITDLHFGDERFDYIICHGVFSWAPREAQEAIFRICGETLSQNGVALVSYNVLPGWSLRQAIRDICLRHAGSEGPPLARVAKVRAILADIAAAANAQEPYGLLLRNEAARLAHRPASYIMGEFLAAENTPCFFQDFVARARQRGLDYLCEADLAAAAPEILGPTMKARLAANAGDDPISTQQYADYFTGRTFRCSMLARADARAFDANKLASLHFSAELHADASSSDTAAVAYKDARGRVVRGKTPAVARALARLAAAYPATLSFAELGAPEPGVANGERPESREQLLAALSTLTQTGQAEAWIAPLRVGRATDAKPQVWPVARAEAAAGQIWLTSLTHMPVLLKPAVALLAPHLDGAHNRDALSSIVEAALRAGKLEAPELKGAPSDDRALMSIARDYVSRVLDYLARNALLAPAGN